MYKLYHKPTKTYLHKYWYRDGDYEYVIPDNFVLVFGNEAKFRFKFDAWMLKISFKNSKDYEIVKD